MHTALRQASLGIFQAGGVTHGSLAAALPGYRLLATHVHRELA
jgi:hypothetical protein